MIDEDGKPVIFLRIARKPMAVPEVAGGGVQEKEKDVTEPKKQGIKDRVARSMDIKYGRGHGKCSKCGEVGHRATTCGREGKQNDVETGEVPPQTFGEQVQELKSQGMTSREVAELLGASVSKVNEHWVNPEGERRPKNNEIV